MGLILFAKIYLAVLLSTLVFSIPSKYRETIRNYYLVTLLKIFKYVNFELECERNKTNNNTSAIPKRKLNSSFNKKEISLINNKGNKNNNKNKDKCKVRLNRNQLKYFSDQTVSELNRYQENQLVQRKIVLQPGGVVYKSRKIPKEYFHPKADDSALKCEHFFEYMLAGFEAIIEDEVTPRFEHKNESKEWNLLFRTRNFSKMPWKIAAIYYVGLFIRYVILLPVRVMIYCFSVGIFITYMIFLACFLDRTKYQNCYNILTLLFHKSMSNTVYNFVNFYDRENRPKNGGICVANHTSPFDTLLLQNDLTCAVIGQTAKGTLGLFQKCAKNVVTYLLFERSESKDRNHLIHRIRQHISDVANPPVLIHPEGTCINNTGIMLFKKGCFEIGNVIYPVAIRYDPRFGNGFWNSARESTTKFYFMMMTSWAIVGHVWYLPPMYQREMETSIEFSSRVRHAIASKICLQEINWDGELKRKNIKADWRQFHQKRIAKYFVR